MTYDVMPEDDQNDSHERGCNLTAISDAASGLKCLAATHTTSLMMTHTTGLGLSQSAKPRALRSAQHADNRRLGPFKSLRNIVALSTHDIFLSFWVISRGSFVPMVE